VKDDGHGQTKGNGRGKGKGKVKTKEGRGKRLSQRMNTATSGTAASRSSSSHSRSSIAEKGEEVVVSVPPGFHKKSAPALHSRSSASAASAAAGTLDVAAIKELGLSGSRYRLYRGFDVSEEVSPWWRFVPPG
jgi:hypothetical protein